MDKIYGDRLNRENYVYECVNLIKVCLGKQLPTTFSIEKRMGTREDMAD